MFSMWQVMGKKLHCYNLHNHVIWCRMFVGTGFCQILKMEVYILLEGKEINWRY